MAVPSLSPLQAVFIAVIMLTARSQTQDIQRAKDYMIVRSSPGFWCMNVNWTVLICRGGHKQCQALVEQKDTAVRRKL